jgi:hypothetical protein
MSPCCSSIQEKALVQPRTARRCNEQNRCHPNRHRWAVDKRPILPLPPLPPLSGGLSASFRCFPSPNPTEWVPGQWINPSSPLSSSATSLKTSLKKNVLSRGRFPLVKLPWSGFGEIPETVLSTNTRPRFHESTAESPLRTHLSLPPPGRRLSTGSSDQVCECRAYPPTNGNAGGKLPRGNRGAGSPRWSFSAAVR